MTPVPLRRALAAVGCAVLALAARAQTVSELAAVARQLEHFDGASLLYDTDGALPESVSDRCEGATPAVWMALLHHDEGAARALAIHGLHGALGPHALPHVMELIDDDTLAPPRRVPVALLQPGPLPLEPQTVGEIARGLVAHYLNSAGYGGDLATAFEAYWRERGTREHCASWWRVELGRASQSSIPTSADRLDEIAALRGRIDRLPIVDRAWVLLTLGTPWEGGNCEPGALEIASEDELVDAARALAERGLLRALLHGGDLGSSDPDLRLARPTAFPYERIAPFVLLNARELLPPDCAPELLELERAHLAGESVGAAPRLISATWAIAAADLLAVTNPELARQTLADALVRHASGRYAHDQDRRCFLAQALWRHGGSAATETLVDWFFAEEPQRGAFGFGRHRFGQWLGAAERLELLRAVCDDPRTRGLDWQTLRILVEAVNAVEGRPLVAENELRYVHHPLGEGHYHWSTSAQRDAHSGQTARLEATLDRWRSTLAHWAR